MSSFIGSSDNSQPIEAHNQPKLLKSINVMIIGSHKYTDILDFHQKQKLFKKFSYTFDGKQTVTDLINNTLKFRRSIKNRYKGKLFDLVEHIFSILF